MRNSTPKRMQGPWPSGLEPSESDDVGVFEVSQTLGDGFVSLDRQWRIRFASAGIGRGGSLFWDLLPEGGSTAHRAPYLRCMQARVPVCFLERVAGEDAWTEVRARPTPDGGVEIAFRDVTTQKQEEARWASVLARAEQARSQAEARSEFEQQLIGIVSHDLRNPLQAIRLSSVLGLRIAGQEPRQKRSFERILASSDRAIRMINDLLDFTRVRSGGGLPLQVRPADLHLLAAQAVDELLVTRPERQIAVEAHGDGMGRWDPDRLMQVLQNLVGNALQHTTEETPVRVTTRGERDFVAIEVHNGGPPIPAEDLPRLLKPFRRGQAAHATGGRSLGLGLYITFHIVQAHGGTISVQSSCEEGTTFAVRLPRGDAPSLRGAGR